MDEADQCYTSTGTVTNLGIDFPLDAFKGLSAIINTQKRETTD